jgi:hypothetical protein
MALFQLDPESIVARVRASGGAPQPAGIGASLARGAIGFTAVAVGGFMPWPLCEMWLRGASETQMHIACAVLFIALSGVCLHRLIIGPGSLSRFYKLFALAFVAFAACWMGCWAWRPDQVGELVGVISGTVAMGAIIAFAFDAGSSAIKAVGALCLLGSLGYYAGKWCEGPLAIDHRFVGMMLWAVCFGSGLGAGLGLAFHFCQEKVRAALAA